MYQTDGGPCNIDASAVVVWNQNSGGLSLTHILHLSSEKSVILYILIPQKSCVRVHFLVFPRAFRYCTDRGYVGEEREREKEIRHTYINLVKDWYLTQQCPQTDVKDYIISMSLISGILFCAVLLYWLLCGLFCSFLERRTLRTRTEKKPGKSCNWLCLSVLWQPTISPADDLQIPGRCVVESQRTGTRTTHSNYFPWNSITYPPASCSPNLGHV